MNFTENQFSIIVALFLVKIKRRKKSMSSEGGKKSRGTALNKHLILFLILCLFEALTLVLTQLDKSAPLKHSQFPPAVLDV